ncbi:MAG TPA: bifunctional aldolase/short-chain dehydrogenase [Steroidobacteraceae bacterium]|jgi:rhamnose utilization protein RhaD (predicted bifunctional aldolase and dehydrogenase)/NAD(P)-dependent dehydrogenase (short-subunit alcohol dehydrogenase family)|nr:bifunctional aldolase/short-chain dehydrogenase [Steroidobacteraceae bacterium]
MRSLWSAEDAVNLVRHYAARGVAEDVALRIYSSRLLGSDPRLVQHGGGNTSVKTRERLITGEQVEVIRVKGSGWNLDAIEPEGLPSMRLSALQELKHVAHMSDEAMVNAQRSALLDSNAPTPSVETLLHAWVPQVVIDHTHANAVLAVVDQPDGEKRAGDMFADVLAICPYVMPGFALAQKVREIIEAQRTAQGIILLKHGIFTWGETAREAYERMIAMVTRAERAIEQASGSEPRVMASSHAPEKLAARVLPVLRGALAQSLGAGAWKRVVLQRRESPSIMSYLQHPQLQQISQHGPATPDHVLRIKPWPLILRGLGESSEAQLAASVREAVNEFAQRYQAYFARNNRRVGGDRTALDPMPRVILAPELGLIGVGQRHTDAATAADVAQTNAEVISAAQSLGSFVSIDEGDVFDVEYWSLEQAKLGKSITGRLAGHVVAITGGGGALGSATARAFFREGAEIVVLDSNAQAASTVASAVQGLGLTCDVTDASAVEGAMHAVCRTYGGLDILVSNAGAAWTGRIGEVDDSTLRASFELNFFAHQNAARAAVAIMRRQQTGGVLLFNASKQALNPGTSFGPYGIPKAAVVALAKQYALDYGSMGIRANVVNADRIRSGLLTQQMIAERAQARGVGEAEYMGGNLLGLEVRASDVAETFLALALAERTTAAIVTVDGGNVAASVR